MFLEQPPESDASGRLFRGDIDKRGYVMNLSRLWAWRPDVNDSFIAMRTLLTSNSTLSQRELGVIVCATAASLGDSYCALAWGKNLADAADAKTAAAVLRDIHGSAMTPRETALSDWARKVVWDPNDTSGEDVEALREAGLTEREIFEATAFIGLRLAFSTVNDALGARPDWQVAAAAPAEVRAAVTFGRPADPHPQPVPSVST